ncbi:DUF3540 domain-containing protein [Serratia sp. UGAL515B_01]|uniref:DUF3540 domain-containing protein n=1 Tax=Serratia sp. UGAL515B_01 TaxID=2986763 RepID=UPI0029537458|nr:DUF3540 domain-containing protein [Serratia sp. UGAL515B_01]
MSDFTPVFATRNASWPPKRHEARSSVRKSRQRSPQITGHIAEDDNGRHYLSSHATLPLMIATSCLVKPQNGDLVCAVLHQHQIFVTAILQRQHSDAALVLSSGTVPMHLSTPALEIHSSERVEIHTSRFSLRAKTSLWISRTLHQVADALFVRAKHAHRQVENTDEVQARHISQQAEQSLIINSRIGSLNASAVLKIDGGQVHMG